MFLVLGCGAGHPSPPSRPNSEVQSWNACRILDDCTWSLGEGGWPAAVNAAGLPAYQEWVRSQAPFTTYFMPGDCFAYNDEFEAYLSRTKSSVACVAGSCVLETEPSCTR